ncbi:glycosyltransferase family 9 protein [Megasphaera sueciensis]|uniref:glycosyltransferase family 9 protein n=1 Tax=Megasphaera sueciensis TaxID=349094 RepID=UPI003D05D86E
MIFDKIKANIAHGILLFSNAVIYIITSVLFTSKEQNILRICIYKVGNIGDLICIIPTLYAIKNYYPDAQIVLLSSPGSLNSIGAADVLCGVSCINKIMLYYHNDINSLSKINCFKKKVKAENFDKLFYLSNESGDIKRVLRDAVFFRFCGIRNATGFRINTVRIFPQAQTKFCHFPNEVERNLSNLPFKCKNIPQFEIHITKRDKCFVNHVLKESGINSNDKIMAISFAGKGEAQCWANENFSEIVRRWGNISDHHKVILIGGLGEVENGNQIMQDSMSLHVLNFCGKFSIQQSFYFMTKILFLLSIDTGTAHMAAAMNTKCIELCTAYDFPNKWVAYGMNTLAIRKNLSCSPCLKKKCKYGYPAKCMQAITINEVWQAIRQI